MEPTTLAYQDDALTNRATLSGAQCSFEPHTYFPGVEGSFPGCNEFSPVLMVQLVLILQIKGFISLGKTRKRVLSLLLLCHWFLCSCSPSPLFFPYCRAFLVYDNHFCEYWVEFLHTWSPGIIQSSYLLKIGIQEQLAQASKGFCFVSHIQIYL
uniref:Uncharacterized protein n=1 Tax=Pipistrellus kuhlii TaxID=59472 RepID=A0A7J8B2A8_PIPKU|nr:hypothetical protein mPipKuh1_007846 [Pipistrellus kuhlii]